MEWSEAERLSWELGSRLVARHPTALRMLRAFPGGGQYDVLWVVGERQRPDIPMNRAGGTIQVHARADGRQPDWVPVDWSSYRRSDRGRFLLDLERAAGLVAPRDVPAVTPESVTYGVISALVQRGSADLPITASLGYVDTSSPLGGGGEDARIRTFGFPEELLAARPDDPHGEPGHRFWIVERGDEPIVAFEQSTAQGRICVSGAAIDTMALLRAEVGPAPDGEAAIGRVADAVLALVDGGGAPEGPRAWILASGSLQRAVVSFDVEEPLQPGDRWTVLLEGPGFAGRLGSDAEPSVERSSDGRVVLSGTSSGVAWRLRPVEPRDTATVTPFIGLQLPTDLLCAIVHASMHHTPDPAEQDGDGRPVRLALVLSDVLDRVVGLVCDTSAQDVQGWSRDGHRWEREALVLREVSKGSLVFDAVVDGLESVPTDPRIAGAIVAVYDTGIPISRRDVAFLTGSLTDPVAIDAAPALVHRLIDGIAGCWLQREAWCRPDEATIVAECFAQLASALADRPDDGASERAVAATVVRGRLLSAIGTCISVLPDPSRVALTTFDRAEAERRTGVAHPDARTFLVRQDLDEDLAEDGW